MTFSFAIQHNMYVKCTLDIGIKNSLDRYTNQSRTFIKKLLGVLYPKNILHCSMTSN